MSSSSLQKVRIALRLAYNGARFHGSMLNVGQPTLPTVEHYLFNALEQCSLISKEHSDAPVPQHVSAWSRSSRTDKGVHSRCTVMSGKIRVDPLVFKDGDQSESLARAINKKLPDDVKVIAIKRVRRRFDARRDAAWRTYSYYLPLLNNVDVSLMKTTCKLFEGTHCFQNYTRAWSKAVSYRKTLPLEQQRALPPLDNVPDSLTRTMSRVSVATDNALGQPMIRITLRGSSFLFNQIRFIISALMYASQKKIPLELIEESLRRDGQAILFALPLAPGAFLVCDTCEFLSPRSPLDAINRREGDVPPLLTSLFDTESDAVRRRVELFETNQLLPHLARCAQSDAVAMFDADVPFTL